MMPDTATGEDGLVSQEDITQTMQGDPRIPAFKRTVGYHADDVEGLLKYGSRSFQGSVAAVLPLSNDHGLVPGSTNIFGRIVMGKSYRGPDSISTALVPEVVGDFTRIIKGSKPRRAMQRAAKNAEARATVVEDDVAGEPDIAEEIIVPAPEPAEPPVAPMALGQAEDVFNRIMEIGRASSKERV